MKKTLVYFAGLILIALAVWYFVFRNKTGFASDEAGFTIEDTSAIGKIFLADKKGNTILLERKETGWLLNGQHKVLQASLNTLLYTLKSQVAQYPVNENAYNNVITMLAGESIKVEVYDKDGDKMMVFYVVGQAGNNQGSYMMMDGSDMPYVVQIPGFEGYVSSRYTTNIKDWRDRIVFDIAQANLQSVKLSYPNEPLNNFVFKKDNNGYMLEAEPALIAGKQINKRRADVYSRFFEKVYCEGFINGTIRLDSVIKNVPLMCTIEATAANGETQQADVYWMPLNRRSKNMLTPFPGIDNQFDADRFYAVINNRKDTVIIQRLTFDKIFRKAYEFYEADDTSGSREIIEVPKGAGNVIKTGSGK
ncbi:hypothetical protein CAP35_14400 [Chitinophagaceae bacterium IBVUCB1]|nr:hypothetical protein CAP35_14400 [Chitinophagaceae bacterium IBVUCB1]